MWKYKYRIGEGLAFSDRKEASVFEKMAARGYALEKVSAWGYNRFKRSQPEECAYSIDFANITADDEGFQEYVEIFAMGGWEYVTRLCDVHYFKAPKGTKTIYTDGSSMAEKYKQMQKSCMWAVVKTGIFAAACIGLWYILLTFTQLPPRLLSHVFITLAGASIGVGAAMFYGLLLNTRRVAKLRKGVGVDDTCDEADSVEKYEKLSKSCRNAFLLSLLVAVGLPVFGFSMFGANAFGIPFVGSGGAESFIWGLSIVCVLHNAFEFIKNKRKVAELRKS